MSSQIFSIIAPVLVCAGIGFTWAKMRVPYEPEFITRLVTNVGFPCLIFVSLATVDLGPEALAVMGIASVVSVAAFAVLGLIALRLANIEWRSFLPSLMFANTGNMGLPLCLLAFGERGLALGVAYFSINAIFVFALGPAITSGNASPIAVLKTPLIWSSIAGITVKLSGFVLPDWLTNTLTLIGGFPIPLMLITLGVSLAQLKTSGLGRAASRSVEFPRGDPSELEGQRSNATHLNRRTRRRRHLVSAARHWGGFCSGRASPNLEWSSAYADGSALQHSRALAVGATRLHGSLPRPACAL